MYVVLPFVPLKPSLMPSCSKNFLYIQCSFVAGFKINIILFCLSFERIERLILSKVDSSTNSSASSSTHVVTPCNDLRFAVWSPLEVFKPLKNISLFEFLFFISLFDILNRSSNFNSSIFSLNSGMIDKCADVIVCLVKSILCPCSNDNNVMNLPTSNDLPLPRPPVITKYLLFEPSKFHVLLCLSIIEFTNVEFFYCDVIVNLLNWCAISTI